MEELREIEVSLKAKGIIPDRATPIFASGVYSETSLDDEYQPSTEREGRFMDVFRALEDLEEHAIIDSLDVRL